MRLIDADALVADLEHDVVIDQDSLDYEELTDTNREIIQFDKDCKQNAIDLLRHAPTIEPERKKGKWVQISPAKIYECSVCGQNVMTDDIDAYRWCHGCGADMRGTE